MNTSQHLAFIHPDLGIGGAEQLVVNLCLAAQNNSYQTHIFTPYHHQSFPQTHNGTIKVYQHGNFFGLIPATICGRFKALLAYIRCLICVLWMIIYSSQVYEIVVVDQVSIVLPILRICGFHPIFYCHFPDKLLTRNRSNILRRIYRYILDLLEELCLVFALKIFVNSEYTKQIFYQNYPILANINIKVEILYPSIDFTKFDQKYQQEQQQLKLIKNDLNNKQYLFSLNRYQRKKNINLAIKSFANYIQKQQQSQIKPQIKLIIAGGYDIKVKENIQYLKELKQLTQTLNISNLVFFYTSITDLQRKFLLRNAKCVLYTPENQHFGIVPCQAMYFNRPIIAHNSGGPKQSIGQDCGILCSSDVKEWSQSISIVLHNKDQSMFNGGRKRMIQKFGFDNFSNQFCEVIKKFGINGNNNNNNLKKQQ